MSNIPKFKIDQQVWMFNAMWEHFLDYSGNEEAYYEKLDKTNGEYEDFLIEMTVDSCEITNRGIWYSGATTSTHSKEKNLYATKEECVEANKWKLDKLVEDYKNRTELVKKYNIEKVRRLARKLDVEIKIIGE